MTRREKRRNPVSRSIKKKKKGSDYEVLWTVDLAPFRGLRLAGMPKCERYFD
jgi:hypothetical protein